MEDLLEYLSNIFENYDFRKLIFPTTIILLYIIGFVYLYTLIHNNETNKDVKVIDVDNNKISDFIYVDVKGSIENPGVYKLNNNSRVVDAIEASGGITEGANTRFINLSKKLNDGDVVVVYSNTEIENAKKDNIIYIDTPCVCEEVKNDACYKEESNTNGKININTASLDELKTLDGIGDAKANAIIKYRMENGNFKSIEDINNVSGISESVYSKIKENITV